MNFGRQSLANKNKIKVPISVLSIVESFFLAPFLSSSNLILRKYSTMLMLGCLGIRLLE